MRWLFVPAVALVERIGPRVTYALALGLVVLAQGLTLWIGGAPQGRTTGVLELPGAFAVACAVGVLLFGLYALVAIGLWAHDAQRSLRLAIERVASGDLSLRIAAATRDDGARGVWDSLAQMQRNFMRIVSQARTSAGNITRGSREIAAGGVDLSQRTEEQASTLEQTAASMEELAVTVKRNADNCRSARDGADEVTRITTAATASTVELARTMTGIEESSRRVSEISGVIENIAFQTNILALNAAVEAARAGEQGRGFAVVASEVRALAQRCARAAVEIKALVGASVDGVARGSRLAEQAGESMNEVLAGVRNMSAILGEIAVASSQQSAGVEEVKRAVTQIEQATQQNAALVEEGAAAALSFQDEAARLAQAVGAFKVDHMEARDQAVALVRRAIAHLNAFGLERARRDFESPDGGFMHDEFYVFGNNTAGVQLFNARSRERTGQSAIDKKDARGRDFVRAFIEIAKAQGKGWHDYHHVNPVTGHVELKSAYVELVGDVVVGCGIYNDEAPAASSAPAARAARPARLTRFAAPGPARLK